MTFHHSMIVTTDNVTVILDADDVQRLGTILNEGDEHLIHRAAVKAARHVLHVCSTAYVGDPFLLDAHVFMASKMLEDDAAPVDRKAIETVLEAWRAAESQLQPDARLALRLLEPICTMVLGVKDKTVFEEKFQCDVIPRLPLNAAKFMRTYIEVMQQWAEGAALPSSDGHYLENVVASVYKNTIDKALAKKGAGHCKKRLAAAKDALDSYLFD